MQSCSGGNGVEHVSRHEGERRSTRRPRPRTSTHMERCPRIEKAADGLLEGEEAVLHVKGTQIASEKTPQPVDIAIEAGVQESELVPVWTVRKIAIGESVSNQGKGWRWDTEVEALAWTDEQYTLPRGTALRHRGGLIRGAARAVRRSALSRASVWEVSCIASPHMPRRMWRVAMKELAVVSKDVSTPWPRLLEMQDIEVKRALLFSTRLRFAPEAQSIRDAAIDGIMQLRRTRRRSASDLTATPPAFTRAVRRAAERLLGE